MDPADSSLCNLLDDCCASEWDTRYESKSHVSIFPATSHYSTVYATC